MSQRLMCGKGAANRHRWFKVNDVWHSHTISGPKFSLVRLEGHSWLRLDSPMMTLCYCGWRLIFYWPSGAWWHVDWYGPVRSAS